MALLTFAVFMAFTKANPFARPYVLKAAFVSANNIKPNSPVRIAGVEVGKVKKVEAVGGRHQGRRHDDHGAQGQRAPDPRGRAR